MSKTILFYVDDDTDDLEFFSEVATDMDQPFKLFEKWKDLYRQLQNPLPAPAIIFLDLNMPGKSGYEIISELKNSRFSNIPIVVLSTAGDYSVVQQCKKLGADFYIKKVCCASELKKAIDFILTIDWKNSDSSKFLYRSRLAIL